MNDHSDHSHSDSPFDGFSLDEIQENFSALAKELKKEGGQPVGEVLHEAEVIEENEHQTSSAPFYRGYTPTIKDYLERANTADECRDIISYCLKMGEITQEEADRFYYRLEKGGPRAFGTRRPGHYDRKL